MNESVFPWIEFYTEFSTVLLRYKNDRVNLVKKIKTAFSSIEMKLPTLENGEPFDIDPFTVFGLFNRGITDANRIRILQGFAIEFNVHASVPTSFDGIPVLNNQKSTFYAFLGDRGEHDLDNLWELFQASINYADDMSDKTRREFIKCYDTVLPQKCVRWNITMALFWIRPYVFINLDSRNRDYIINEGILADACTVTAPNLSTVPDGAAYLNLCGALSNWCKAPETFINSFPELSRSAWQTTHSITLNDRNKVDALSDESGNERRYWLYSPGDSAAIWDECYNSGIMAIGWDVIGNLSLFASKEEMKSAMKENIDPSKSYKMAAHATWQFVHDIKPGDIIIAKKGLRTVIGRGIVESEYIFDDTRSHYKNIRKVKWTDKGEWDHPGQAAMKTLTDITPFSDYIAKLNDLFSDSDAIDDVDVPEITYPPYTSEDFLSEVYMSREDYDILAAVLMNKKNIILQGAPGVGKTFAAKRLAYSVMGEKDKDRVMMVQFHQSYSYEDFIMGFRPSESGFELKKGAFYNFCKKAEEDSDNAYFFIIDEINRGNLSKIFGELFMLIETDKRGIELQLLYSDEKFSVPTNVYIIGMMNTADRSLALLDYALRRRFSFIELKPGFETDGFRNYRTAVGSEKFNRLIATIESLNTAIANDDSLGEGFCIGHSYFCNLSSETVSDQALSAIVEFEIIPLLKEYWFDEPTKVRDWSSNLRSAIK